MNSSAGHSNALLFSFFSQLKKAGFALGIEEYKLFIEVIRHSPPAGKDQLLRLLSLLWLKSEKDRGDFGHIFQIVFAELDERLQPPARPEKEFEDREDPARPPQPPEPTPPPPKDEGDTPPARSDDPPQPDAPTPTAGADEVASLRIRLEAKKPAPEAAWKQKRKKITPSTATICPSRSGR